MSEHEERRRRGDQGFTLIELLVVIIILGILAAVVVFAVSGVGDKGASAARAIEARTLRTAQEAFFARNSHYASADELVSGGFLADLPGYYQTEAVPVGTPDSSGGGSGSNDPSKGSFIVYCDEGQPGCIAGSGAVKLGWSAQSAPTGFTQPLKDVHFVDHERGFAVGATQACSPCLPAVIRTTNGGTDWTEVVLPAPPASPVTTLRPLQDVDCAPGTTLCVAVGRATILRTVNGADWSWIAIPVGVISNTSTLWGVDVLNEQEAWIAGIHFATGGFLLKTIDGGASWNTVLTSLPVELRDVHFEDAQHGWIIGGDLGTSEATVYRTTTGGATLSDWSKQSLGEVVRPTDLDFIDNQRGWIVGVGGRNWKTIDGGGTWTSKPNMCGNRDSVSFVDSDHGWSGGNTGCVIAVTADGADSWAIESAKTSTAGLPGVHMLDIAHGWAVGTVGEIRVFRPVP